MLLEGLVATACLTGNADACNTSLDKYIKYNNLNEQIRIIENKVHHSYPVVYFIGTTTNVIINKRYSFLMKSNIWLQGDFNNPKNFTNELVYKKTF